MIVVRASRSLKFSLFNVKIHVLTACGSCDKNAIFFSPLSFLYLLLFVRLQVACTLFKLRTHTRGFRREWHGIDCEPPTSFYSTLRITVCTNRVARVSNQVEGLVTGYGRVYRLKIQFYHLDAFKRY